MEKKTKKKLFLILFILLSFILICNVAGTIVYFSIFNKVERPDYKITPGLINYEEIKEELPRKIYNYSSEKEILTGYYYDCDSNKPLIVISHGINDGADSLLSVCKFFIDNHFDVFSYDNTGCFSSTGTVNGFSQSLIDLKNTLYFLNSHDDFKTKEKILFGFSAGGYANTAIFNITSTNIVGCISVSGFNDASSLIVEKGNDYIGPIAFLGKGLIDIIQHSLFKDYINYTSVNGINKSSIPFFIAHSSHDEIILYNDLSIASCQNKITNENMIYYTMSNKSHSDTLYSACAINYRKEVNASLKKLNKKEKEAYVSQIDDYKYSELDKSLFDNILIYISNILNR